MIVQLPEAYELSNIILALTPYGRSDPWEVRKDFPYYEAVMRHFAPHLAHPLLAEVSFSRDRWREYLSFRTDAVAFAFDQSGKLRRTRPFSTHDDLSPFDDHLELIEDFAAVSGFRAFFADHRDYYDSIIAEYGRYYHVQAMLRFLGERTGESPTARRHLITLSPLVYRMNAHREIDDSTSGDFPTLSDHLVGAGTGGGGSLVRAVDVHTLFTETSHGFINPVSDRFAEMIRSHFDYTRWQRDAGYESALGTFNEYMTWAAYDLFVREEFPAEAAEASLYWHYQNAQRGFLYSHLFAGKVRQLYEARREEGGRLEDLYPDLLSWTLERQEDLKQPSVVGQAATVMSRCDGPEALDFEYSEPMHESDSVSVIVQDGPVPVDTLLLARDAGAVGWSNDARMVTLRLSVPPLDSPYLVFNWWGARYPLSSRSGVLMGATTIEVRCDSVPHDLRAGRRRH